MRKRKATYPPPKTATKRAPSPLGAGVARGPADRTVVSINTAAMTGNAAIRPGDRVRIMTGLYESEIAVVESTASGVIPAAMVRTEAGRARRVRTIDLEPVGPAPVPAPASEATSERDPEPPIAQD